MKRRSLLVAAAGMSFLNRAFGQGGQDITAGSVLVTPDPEMSVWDRANKEIVSFKWKLQTGELIVTGDGRTATISLKELMDGLGAK
jgi:hypothetical protein